ncbi:MAG: LamG-like jellyroll fold domain-containing protein [Candidatus Oleimicrobiaceae bacterium]
MMRVRTIKAAVLVGGVAALMTAANAQQVGGPYTPDENTMLLLHFDGDLKNASQFSADGEFHGAMTNFFFLPNPISGLDKCLRIDNDSRTDSAYVTVADTQYLDLTGDWTIEGWINIFTFGEGSDDWRWVPRLVIKTGDEVFWRPNYFVEMWGSTRFFSCGYHTASQDAWPQANSPDNTMVPGQWYHMAFIRDTNKHVLLTIIHDAQRNLRTFAVADYLTFGAADPTPITTSMPLHIGYAGGGGDSFLDGFVDEIRVSNVVRQYAVPPIVSTVTVMPNQTADVTTYPIGAVAYTLMASVIQSVTLYYAVGTGPWQSVPMTHVAGDSFAAAIPQQPLGSIVKYYVEATDNQGLSFAYPRDAGWGAMPYYTFGIYSQHTNILSLGFEEGSGTPVDGSPYNNPITVVGAPTYSTDAAVGNYSLYLEGDSSYLEVDSPFLSSTEFCVDLWFKADTIENYCRIINRPATAQTWSDNNYQIRFDDNRHIQGIVDGTVTLTTTAQVEPGKWYHVVFEVQDAPPGFPAVCIGSLLLEDSAGTKLHGRFLPSNTPVRLRNAPLRIGKAAGGTYPPYFQGRLDEVKVYNYPAARLYNRFTGVEPLPAEVPARYELTQNYPNPFNPTTEIRFSVPQRAKVTLVVYNLLGSKVKTLVNKEMVPGRHAVTWDGTDEAGREVASGVYIYRMEAAGFAAAQKMLLVR